MLVERITWNTYGLARRRVRAHRYIALTCKTRLVSRSMSNKVHIEDIATNKKVLKDPKIFLLYVIRFNAAINYYLFNNWIIIEND